MPITRIKTALEMKRRALSYLESVMTDDPPVSDLMKRDALQKEIGRLSDWLLIVEG